MDFSGALGVVEYNVKMETQAHLQLAYTVASVDPIKTSVNKPWVDRHSTLGSVCWCVICAWWRAWSKGLLRVQCRCRCCCTYCVVAVSIVYAIMRVVVIVVVTAFEKKKSRVTGSNLGKPIEIT